MDGPAGTAGVLDRSGAVEDARGPSRGITRRAFLTRVAAAGLGVGSLLAVSCAEWPRPSTVGARAPAPSPSSGPTPVALALPPEPRIDVLPLRHLVESGFFAARELTVQLVWGPGPYGALPELVAQRAPFALVDVPTAARAAEQKVELLGVFHLYAADPAIVFALERAAIRDAEQLVGQRIGVSSPHLAGAFALRAALREAGLEAGQVELVSAAGDLPTLLESGRVAAVAGSRHLAPGLEQRGLRTVYLPRAGWEAVPGPLIAASRAFAAERPDVVKRFVGALRSGIQGTLADPSALRAAAERILANGPAERGAVRAQVESLLASLSPSDEGQGPGWLDPGRVVAVERYLRELGVTKGTAELSKVLVNDFLIGGTSPR